MYSLFAEGEGSSTEKVSIPSRPMFNLNLMYYWGMHYLAMVAWHARIGGEGIPIDTFKYR